MLMALCFGSVLLFAGQASIHRAQPVQSSGATCSKYFWFLKLIHLAAVDLNDSGAPFSLSDSYTFARITAWGQTSTHLPHCIQSCSSQSGISSAILRFSHCAVPVGKVPSMGSLLTGSRSPSP